MSARTHHCLPNEAQTLIFKVVHNSAPTYVSRPIAHSSLHTPRASAKGASLDLPRRAPCSLPLLMLLLSQQPLPCLLGTCPKPAIWLLSRLSKWIITNNSHFVTSFPGRRIFKWVCKNKSYQFFSHWTHGENSGAHLEVRCSEGRRLWLLMLPDCAGATAPRLWPVVRLAPSYACCWKILVALLLLCKSAFGIWAWQESEPVCEN